MLLVTSLPHIRLRAPPQKCHGKRCGLFIEASLQNWGIRPTIGNATPRRSKLQREDCCEKTLKSLAGFALRELSFRATLHKPSQIRRENLLRIQAHRLPHECPRSSLHLQGALQIRVAVPADQWRSGRGRSSTLCLFEVGRGIGALGRRDSGPMCKGIRPGSVILSGRRRRSTARLSHTGCRTLMSRMRRNTQGYPRRHRFDQAACFSSPKKMWHAPNARALFPLASFHIIQEAHDTFAAMDFHVLRPCGWRKVLVQFQLWCGIVRWPDYFGSGNDRHIVV